ncbi:MAG TPA: alkaline phosphatase family protein, partial [Candidatus Baltobacteraceae bacterium]|nr:alkaline phosphatase family protein [Candidatus Baltobacteraceae bacterium]
MRSTSLRRAFVAVLVAVATACSGPPLPGGPPGQRELPPTIFSGLSGKIQHVVVIVQENRSFDNFFATYPGADGATSGLCRHAGTTTTVQLRKVNLLTRYGEPPLLEIGENL